MYIIFKKLNVLFMFYIFGKADGQWIFISTASDETFQQKKSFKQTDI